MNPLDQKDNGGSSGKFVTPMCPPYDGKQFARDAATPEEIEVSRNQFYDEIPNNSPFNHTGASPMHSNPQYTGRQYSDDWKGGFTNYGVSVTPSGP